MAGNHYPNPHGASCPWYDITEKFGAPNIKWCEETLCQWISEPANTWSNMLYIIIAVHLFFKWNKHTFLPLRYAPVTIFIIGFASICYHISNFYPSQILDYIGMFFCLFNILLMNIHRLKKLTQMQFLISYIALITISTLLLHIAYLNYIPVQSITFIIAVFILVTEFYCYKKNHDTKNYKNYFIGQAFLILAVISLTIDGNRIWCDPTNHWIQGHALWHIFGAITMYFI